MGRRAKFVKLPRRSVRREVLPFPELSQCSSEGRDNQTVVSDLDGTLIQGGSSFPFFMLVAFEAGSYLRAVILLAVAPISWVLYNFISEACGIKLLIFVSLAGLKLKRIQIAARAVLPKFYADDLDPEAWQVFSSFGRRYVLTANPRVMVEPFVTEYLGADGVIGTEIEVSRSGRATGFVKKSGVLIGAAKEKAMVQKLESCVPDVGLGDRRTDWPFMARCKEGYVVPARRRPSSPNTKKVQLPKPVVFYDGRLVRLPTPRNALLVFLWLPIGFALSIVRVASGSLLPMSLTFYAYRALGVRVRVRGTPPPPAHKGSNLGVLFICNHRSLLDPVFLSSVLGRRVSAVTYSISRVSEFLSPIKTVALSRNRDQDARDIRTLLEEGDLAICPEGTTSREPILLRFSSLFAELTDQIVPVAMTNRMSMFHGTTATGWKGMDPFFFFMNPSPIYEVSFVPQVPRELTCVGGGRTSHEVANHVQQVLAGRLGFQCTNFTRKHKYNVLAGSDGSIAPLRVTASGALTCSDIDPAAGISDAVNAQQLLRV